MVQALQYSSVKTKPSAEEKPLKITPTTVEIKLLYQEDPKWVQKTLVGKIHRDILGLFSPQCCLSLVLRGSLYFGVICVKLKG